MLYPILVLLVTHLLLPLYFFYIIWRAEDNSKFGWLVKVLLSGVFFTYLFIAGRWDWVSMYLRYLYVGVFALLVFISYQRVRQRPFFVQNGRSPWRRHAWPLVELVLLTGFVIYIATGFFYGGDPVRLEFPLEDGRFYVGQGGDNPFLNAHNSHPAQQYALDITELNAAGVRVPGIYPSDPNEYVIFGETIYSPCEGTVAEAVDGLPDHNPPETDTENLAGNHVIIGCKDVKILLAHMLNGSVQVEAGDMVDARQPLGKVGNSGNTTEPHLHIHAVPNDATVLEGEGVPMLFEDDFPVRNTLFIE